MGVEPISDSTVTTGVDSLLALLKEKKKISLEDASKKLKIKQDILQTWVDFLVEEKVVGTEYKFTKPYIYLNKQEDGTDRAKNLSEAKEIYKQSLKAKGIGDEEAEYYWKDKLLTELKDHKEEFMKLAKQKKIENSEFLWEKFLDSMLK